MSQPRTAPSQPRIFTGVTVGPRLDALGFREREILEAVEAGEADRSACTLNDALHLGGTILRSRTLRTLRELKLVDGWYRGDLGGIEVLLNPKSKVAVAVNLGTPETGVAGADPRTKNPKGSSTKQAVRSNAAQLSLLLDEPALEEPELREGYEFWMLLVVATDEEVRCELSRPWRMSGTNVERWYERVIPPPVSRNPDAPLPSRDDSEPGQEIEIDISRKSDAA